VSVVEEFLLPAVKQVGGDAELIAEMGHGCFLQEVPFEDGDILLGGLK
jgi:hypothetical protein